MQYQVPQFIEVEDRIFGPLTLRQFIYLAGNGGVCLIFLTLLPFYVAFIASLPFIALGLALAFYKVNDRPLMITIEHAFKYYLGSKLYLWKPRENTAQQAAAPRQSAPVQTLSIAEGKLKDLSWSLNIKDKDARTVEPQHPESLRI